MTISRERRGKSSNGDSTHIINNAPLTTETQGRCMWVSRKGIRELQPVVKHTEAKLKESRTRVDGVDGAVGLD